MGIVVFGCSQNTNTLNQNSQPNNEIIEIVESKIDTTKEVELIEQKSKKKDNLFDFDSLEIGIPDLYYSSFKNGELSLCCFELLNAEITDLKIFKKSTENYELDGSMQDIDVYIYGESFIKKYYNHHPKVNHLDLVCGRIVSSNIKLSQGIKIGMSKSALMERIFKPSPSFDSVSRLTIYENEMGEKWTSYIFNKDSLTEILFDSEYDWIDKELK